MSRQIYYCSDHHFYHNLIWQSKRRSDFESIQEMNEILIENHNRKVSEDDIVYFLGDVIFSSSSELELRMKDTVGRMNGEKILILGNHDFHNIKKSAFSQYFKEIREIAVIQDSGNNIHLCHYPLLSWWNKIRGSYHIHGHLHGIKDCKEFEVLKGEERALSACLDVNNYEPCTLEDLIINNRIWKE